MHHQIVFACYGVLDGQALLAQPRQHLGPVGRVQHAVQRVAAPGLAHAVGYGQQMQIVVAQQALRLRAIRHQAP